MNQEWLELIWGCKIDLKWSQCKGRPLRYHPITVIVTTTAFAWNDRKMMNILRISSLRGKIQNRILPNMKRDSYRLVLCRTFSMSLTVIWSWHFDLRSLTYRHISSLFIANRYFPFSGFYKNKSVIQWHAASSASFPCGMTFRSPPTEYLKSASEPCTGGQLN
jgi:hypothetical protein